MVRIGDEGRMVICGPTLETTRILDIKNKLGEPDKWVLSVKDGNKRQVDPDRFYMTAEDAKAARLYLWKEIEHMQAEESRVGKQSGPLTVLMPVEIRVSGSLCDIGCPFYQPQDAKEKPRDGKPLPWHCELFDQFIIGHKRCGACRQAQVKQ